MNPIFIICDYMVIYSNLMKVGGNVYGGIAPGVFIFKYRY